MTGVQTCALPISFALTSEQSKAVAASLKATKVVEVPARALEIVNKASAENRVDYAVATIGATAKVRPSALINTITAVLTHVPDAAEKAVRVAVEFAPDSSPAIVQAAVAAVPGKSAAIVQAASRVQPAKAAAFQRESLAVTARSRSVSVVSAAATTGPTITQAESHIGDPAPINLYAFPGSDPSRP